MKKKYIIYFIIILFLLSGCKNNKVVNETTKPEEQATEQEQIHEEKIEFVEKLTIELGKELPKKEEYIKNGKLEEINIKYKKENKDIEEFTIGTYDVYINEELVSKLIIVDTTPPNLVLKDITIKEGEKYTIDSFVKECTDISKDKCLLELENNDKNITKPGTYKISIAARDNSGNKITKEATLIIKEVPKVIETKTETKKDVEDYKYGIKKVTTTTITYNIYSDGTKKETKKTIKTSYDTSNYKATAKDLESEAISNVSKNDSYIKEVVKYTNEYRKEVGAKDLTIDKDYNIIAAMRAMEIAYTGIKDHSRPNGTWCFEIIYDGVNYPYFAGENIAWGQTTPEKAAIAWRNSPPHYANMTSPMYSKIGIGYYKFNNNIIWVQVLG